MNSGSASGFGLKSISSSLELLYGGRAVLKVENVPAAGSRVTVTIPQES